MEEDDYLQFKKELSKINEKRKEFWAELRNARNEFLSNHPPKNYKDDSQWQEIYCFIRGMWESTFKEELRRQMGLPIKGIDSRRLPRGLYKNNLLCEVCGFPLTGRQKANCSDYCRNVKKSKKYRATHPEEKQKSNLKYLKECFPGE